MPITAVHPTIEVGPFLPGAQFSDAYSVITDDMTLDARSAAEKMFANTPRWMRSLMKLRDAIVTPFGLKTEHMAKRAPNRVGFFPVISETPQRLVAGLDDSHQDFRVVVDVTPIRTQCRVTVTTIVRTHNVFGRAYLTSIMPFHRIIVRAMLRQIGSDSYSYSRKS